MVNPGDIRQNVQMLVAAIRSGDDTKAARIADELKTLVPAMALQDADNMAEQLQQAIEVYVQELVGSTGEFMSSYVERTTEARRRAALVLSVAAEWLGHLPADKARKAVASMGEKLAQTYVGIKGHSVGYFAADFGKYASRLFSQPHTDLQMSDVVPVVTRHGSEAPADAVDMGHVWDAVLEATATEEAVYRVAVADNLKLSSHTGQGRMLPEERWLARHMAASPDRMIAFARVYKQHIARPAFLAAFLDPDQGIGAWRDEKRLEIRRVLQANYQALHRMAIPNVDTLIDDYQMLGYLMTLAVSDGRNLPESDALKRLRTVGAHLQKRAWAEYQERGQQVLSPMLLPPAAHEYLAPITHKWRDAIGKLSEWHVPQAPVSEWANSAHRLETMLRAMQRSLQMGVSSEVADKLAEAAVAGLGAFGKTQWWKENQHRTVLTLAKVFRAAVDLHSALNKAPNDTAFYYKKLARKGIKSAWDKLMSQDYADYFDLDIAARHIIASIREKQEQGDGDGLDLWADLLAREAMGNAPLARHLRQQLQENDTLFRALAPRLLTRLRRGWEYWPLHEMWDIAANATAEIDNDEHPICGAIVRMVMSHNIYTDGQLLTRMSELLSPSGKFARCWDALASFQPHELAGNGVGKRNLSVLAAERARAERRLNRGSDANGSAGCVPDA